MLAVAEAQQLVIDHAGRQLVAAVPLEEAQGLVLAEPVVSDVDSPPFTKALMDGYAIRSADLRDGTADLEVVGELTAGNVAAAPLAPGTALRIMTGAPLPNAADAVVMVERSQILGERRVRLDDPQFRPGQNVMSRGREFAAGETVLSAGHLLGAAEAGLLASVGCVRPKVYRQLNLAVLSTGDELVSPERTPTAAQIRNSNAATLLALARQANVSAASLGIARDQRGELARKVAEGLRFDVLLLSGGVSAGTLDLVPSVLEEHGVKSVFHKVDFKPGKPIWFGTHKNGLVFGLPGNPVSVLACFVLFVQTALRARMGWGNPLPIEFPAELSQDIGRPIERLTYHPARVSCGERWLQVEPLAWFGSPDLRALANANALLVLPPTPEPYQQGTWLKAIPFRGETHGG